MGTAIGLGAIVVVLGSRLLAGAGTMIGPKLDFVLLLGPTLGLGLVL